MQRPKWFAWKSKSWGARSEGKIKARRKNEVRVPQPRQRAGLHSAKPTEISTSTNKATDCYSRSWKTKSVQLHSENLSGHEQNKSSVVWYGYVSKCSIASPKSCVPLPTMFLFPHPSHSHRHACAEDYTVRGVGNKCEEWNWDRKINVLLFQMCSNYKCINSVDSHKLLVK